MANPSVVLEAWAFACTRRSRSLVLPDGCQDLIVHTDAAGARRCFVSDLPASAYAVESAPGAAFRGFRFHPGAVCDTQALLRAFKHGNDVSDLRIGAVIADCVRVDASLVQALASLSQRRSVAAAARALGISERTLERLLRQKTGHPPRYWKNLARVRRAARTLAEIANVGCAETADDTASIAELAIDCGFSDQSHMSREFRRWFAVTPTQFRADPNLLQSIAAPGYF